jgi:hypothetical protein
MNVINRIVIVLALLCIMVAVTVVCLFPHFFVGQVSLLADRLDDLLPRVELADHLILIGIAAAVDIVLFVFLLAQLYRPRVKSVRVQQIDGGTAMLTADSIRQRLAFFIDGLADVVSVKPEVVIKRDAVRVAVDVQTSATVNVPAKAQEIVGVIRTVVTETMGLQLRGEPQVRIRTGRFIAASKRPASMDQPKLPARPVTLAESGERVAPAATAAAGLDEEE